MFSQVLLAASRFLFQQKEQPSSRHIDPPLSNLWLMTSEDEQLFSHTRMLPACEN